MFFSFYILFYYYSFSPPKILSPPSLCTILPHLSILSKAPVPSNFEQSYGKNSERAGAKKTSLFQAVCMSRRTQGVMSGCRIKYERTIVNQNLLNGLFCFRSLPGRCTCAPSQLQMIYIFVFLFNIQHMRHTHGKIKKGGKQEEKIDF